MGCRGGGENRSEVTLERHMATEKGVDTAVGVIRCFA